VPRYLDTRGQPTLTVGVCDRCHMKRPLAFLVSDRNSPGLRVCPDTCNDLYDPYRLPARRAENIAPRYPRPEEPLEEPT
jgi:hypothetical protein